MKWDHEFKTEHLTDIHVLENGDKTPVGINTQACTDGTTFVHIHDGPTQIGFYLSEEARQALIRTLQDPPGPPCARPGNDS